MNGGSQIFTIISRSGNGSRDDVTVLIESKDVSRSHMHEVMLP